MAIAPGDRVAAHQRFMMLLDDMAELDEQSLAAALWQQMMTLAAFGLMERGKQGGSLPGKAANKARDFASGHRRLMLDYF
jgi:hypothetical protein